MLKIMASQVDLVMIKEGEESFNALGGQFTGRCTPFFYDRNLALVG